MADYTKGPWGVFNHNGTICIDNRGGDGHRPCIVDWPGFDGNEMSRKENEANAQLIAAAPDLLQMLKVAQLWLDVDGRYDMQGINAAIAKAEGRE